MAALRRENLKADVALTGVITADGRIREVGDLPTKLDAAACANIHVVLVPQEQARTSEWDLHQLAGQRNVTVLEVASLRDAYEWIPARDRSSASLLIRQQPNRPLDLIPPSEEHHDVASLQPGLR